MKRALFACLALGCGSSPPHADVVERSPIADDVGTSTRERTLGPTAVEQRLAAQLAFALPWGTALRSLSDAQLVDWANYEVQEISPEPVERDCGDGRHARVAVRTSPADRIQTLRRTGARCDVTIGELAACELAVRERPCAYAGIGLPECLALDACDEVVRMDEIQIIVTCERMNGCGDR